MHIPQPQNQITWQEWVSANAYLASGVELKTICEILGITVATWETVNPVWMKYLEDKLNEDTMFGNEYGQMFANPAVGKFKEHANT